MTQTASLKDSVMTYSQFEKLKDWLETTLTFDETNLSSKLQSFTKWYSSLTNICVSEELYVAELRSELATLLSEVQDSIKTGRILYDNREEVKIRMNGDVRLKELNLEIAKRETMIRYLQTQQENLKSLRFDVSNFIKWKEYESGK